MFQCAKCDVRVKWAGKFNHVNKTCLKKKSTPVDLNSNSKEEEEEEEPREKTSNGMKLAFTMKFTKDADCVNIPDVFKDIHEQFLEYEDEGLTRRFIQNIYEEPPTSIFTKLIPADFSFKPWPKLLSLLYSVALLRLTKQKHIEEIKKLKQSLLSQSTQISSLTKERDELAKKADAVTGIYDSIRTLETRVYSQEDVIRDTTNEELDDIDSNASIAVTNSETILCKLDHLTDSLKEHGSLLRDINTKINVLEEITQGVANIENATEEIESATSEIDMSVEELYNKLLVGTQTVGDENSYILNRIRELKDASSFIYDKVHNINSSDAIATPEQEEVAPVEPDYNTRGKKKRALGSINQNTEKKSKKGKK